MKWSRFANSDGDDFVPGDWNIIDDRSGFKIKASQAVRQWDGAMVRADLAEVRNPQDFLRGKPESAPTWGRPEQPDVFGQTDADDL